MSRLSDLLISVAFSAFAVSSTVPFLACAAATASVHQETIRKHDRLSDMDVHYPKIDSLPQSPAINSAIVKSVKAKIAEFLRSGRSETERSSFSGTYQVAMTTPDIVSIRFQFENRCPPDGRPLETIEDFNYSAKQSESIALESVFQESVEYLDVLSVLSLSDLVNKEELGTVEAATSPNAECFQDFTLSKTGIDIHFGSEKEMEASASAMGEHTVHVPYATVRNLLSPSSPVYELASQSHQGKTSQMLETGSLEDQLGAIAVAAYSSAIEKSPDNAPAYRKRAEWRKKLGQNALAEADLVQATELEAKQREATVGTVETPTESMPVSIQTNPTKPEGKTLIIQPQPVALWVIGAILVVGIFFFIKRRRHKAK